MKNLFLFIVALFAGALAQENIVNTDLVYKKHSDNVWFLFGSSGEPKPYIGDAMIVPSIVFGQIEFGNVVTDSIVWRVMSVDNAGDSTCCHEWVESESYRAGGYSYCCVFHAGFHCDWDDLVKYRICRLCLRKETLREQWYQNRAEPPKTEYDRLQEKLDNDKK